MNGEDLLILTTNLLGGTVLDEDMFYQLLNSAKNQREMMRDWMALRAEDSSLTFTAADTYLTGKNLPARFLRTYQFRDSEGDLSGPFIVDSSGNKTPLKAIKFEQRFDYKDTPGYYYIDHKNRTISRTGTTAGTLHLFFIQGSEDITAATAWTLPPTDSYGVLLAYDVAVEQKGGIDWDTVNANQVPYNQRKIFTLESNLATWDSRLQQAELGV